MPPWFLFLHFFLTGFWHRRCLLPAMGWFEWQNSGKGKQPHHIRLATGRPMAVAGIWEEQDGTACFTLLNQAAIPDLQPIHHRQPVVVDTKAFAIWLQPDSPAGKLMGILQAEPPSFSFWPVLDLVNNVRNNTPEIMQACI